MIGLILINRIFILPVKLKILIKWTIILTIQDRLFGFEERNRLYNQAPLQAGPDY